MLYQLAELTEGEMRDSITVYNETAGSKCGLFHCTIQHDWRDLQKPQKLRKESK